jgi:putative membrane protein
MLRTSSAGCDDLRASSTLHTAPQMNFIGRLIANAAALWVASYLLAGIQYTGSWPGLLGVALLFGLVNTLIKPVLTVLSLPVQVLTLGMFTFVINALLLMLTSWLAGSLGIAFVVDGFVTALIGALIVSIVSGLLSVFLVDD